MVFAVIGAQPQPLPATVAAEFPDGQRLSLTGDDASEAREAARDLIDTVILHPPVDPEGPGGIELVGNLSAMIAAARNQATPGYVDEQTNPARNAFLSSDKEGLRAQPPAGPELAPAKAGGSALALLPSIAAATRFRVVLRSS